MTQWRPIPSYPDYEASSDGDVRRANTMQIRKKQTHWKGYQTFGIRIDGQTRSISVHRSVCEAFHGRCPEGHQAGHKNGIRSDNRAENLYWITPKENQADRIRHGTTNNGTRHGRARLNRQQLEEIIFRVGRKKEKQSDVGRDYGVAQATISEIMSAKIYCEEWGLKP